ncbi:MAG: DUF2809 domain-containing protein [Gemmatimonadales bacterium]
MSQAGARTRYAVRAALTIAAGLAVHRFATGLPAAVRDVAGDVLWAAMIVWLLAVLAPPARRPALLVGALLICFGVELSQLVQVEWLAALRRTGVGRLVLGSGFDPRDFVSYAVGVGLAGLADRTAIARGAASPPTRHPDTTPRSRPNS